mmetsp:Transcript_23510/g.60081  ORF Transcript_23510/g.60081 Transcript_23510/m.60081 type:complete len:134 (+) Transcript_23510:1812-2213(+)
MSDAINDGLREQAWFVTGRGLPAYFSDTFTFSDPDGSIAGYEAYCRQVRRLFDQQSARCEVICCSVTAPNTITVVWRARYGDLKSPAKEFHRACSPTVHPPTSARTRRDFWQDQSRVFEYRAEAVCRDDDTAD